MTSKLVDEHNHSKFRLRAEMVRHAIEAHKYDSGFRCADCGQHFAVNQEVWGLEGYCGPSNEEAIVYVHYDCEVANR